MHTVLVWGNTVISCYCDSLSYNEYKHHDTAALRITKVWKRIFHYNKSYSTLVDRRQVQETAQVLMALTPEWVQFTEEWGSGVHCEVCCNYTCLYSICTVSTGMRICEWVVSGFLDITWIGHMSPWLLWRRCVQRWSQNWWERRLKLNPSSFRPWLCELK